LLTQTVQAVHIQVTVAATVALAAQVIRFQPLFKQVEVVVLVVTQAQAVRVVHRAVLLVRVQAAVVEAVDMAVTDMEAV
jgi:hypothetical protein